MNIAPRRVLLPLTAAVLLAHLGLLQYASHASRQPATGSVAPLAMRVIPAPAPPRLPGAAANPPLAPPLTPPRALALAPHRPAATTPSPAAARRAVPTPPSETPTAQPEVAADTPRLTPPTEVSAAQMPGSDPDGASSASATPPASPASATSAASASTPASAATATAQAAGSPPSSAASLPLVSASGPAPAAIAPGEARRRLLATRYQALPSVRLGYDVLAEVKGVPLRAQGELLWQQDGQNYTARMEIKAFLLGSRVQTSAGHITAHALAPTRFSDKSRSELAAHFREDQGRVTFSANTPDAPLQPMAQDRLSIFLQLAGMLAAEPTKYPPGTRISMQTVGPRSAEEWEFTVEAEEPLDLAGGRMTGLKLVHAPALDFDQRVELWFAPVRGYQPVRIRLTQADGSFVDMQWRTSDTP